MVLLPIIFGAITFWAWRAGETLWLLTDACGSMLFGIPLFLTPRWMLEWQTVVHVDDVSMYLTQFLGVLLLSSSLISHRAFKTGDRRERTAVAMSRTISALFVVVIGLYAKHHYKDWNIQFFYMSVVGGSMWCLPHVWFALTHPSEGKVRTENRVVLYLLLDYFVSHIVGAIWFAFPQWLLRMQAKCRPNGVSVTMARICGALLIGQGSVSLSATQFANMESLQFVYASRLSTALGLLALISFAQLWYDGFTTTHIVVGIITCFFWTANSVLGHLTVSAFQDNKSAAPTDKNRRPFLS